MSHPKTSRRQLTQGDALWCMTQALEVARAQPGRHLKRDYQGLMTMLADARSRLEAEPGDVPVREASKEPMRVGKDR